MFFLEADWGSLIVSRVRARALMRGNAGRKKTAPRGAAFEAV
jgi:hypothetical protein